MIEKILFVFFFFYFPFNCIVHIHKDKTKFKVNIFCFLFFFCLQQLLTNHDNVLICVWFLPILIMNWIPNRKLFTTWASSTLLYQCFIRISEKKKNIICVPQGGECVVALYLSRFFCLSLDFHNFWESGEMVTKLNTINTFWGFFIQFV